ncbi:hypothetical protein NE237_011461 [Protea cynaroides]|uniref:Pectinesterase inhibitor domain-containing protein n=1 Tax=Protea cynaroides TaxID=273540 RepID=A0A9Q0JYA7_9MAGN|nr:hypothetical protein NE237_011461 [Protea cynaroides]
MMGKAIVAGVSLILVVGVVIGLVAGISRSGHSSNVFSNTDNASSGMKTVKTICEPTDYKDACIKTLGTVADNGTSNPKDFIKVALSATMDEVKAAMARTGSLGNGDYNITQKNALEDCNELLQYAIHELQESLSMVVDNELNIVNQRVPDLTNWLSAVISYQQTCLDGVTHPELKSAVENGLLNATQLTSNALAIVTEISQLLSHINAPINAPLNGNPQQRRLLEAEAIKTDDEGYPTWFSAADRKLLAAQGRGQLRPNAVVAKDGSGQYRTIAAALAAYPKNNRGRYVIYVKAGIYDEYITVTQDQVDVFMYGDGPRRTIVTGNKSNRGGVSTFKTASFLVSRVSLGLLDFLCKILNAAAMMRDPDFECSGCGSEERWFLHNIRHRGTLRRVCTSCVLKLHPGLFCPHCIEVYEGSIPPLHERVMCSKCSSVSHLACVGLENALHYLCPSCSNPSFLFFRVGSSNKKSKFSNGDSVSPEGQGMIDQKLAKIFLSAARIAASSMAKAAAAARVEAERRVKEAAFTRKKAKEALERVAYLVSKEKDKEKKKRKDSTVAPSSVLVMEQNKKAKGNSGAPAAVAVQKPIQSRAAPAVAAQKPIQKNLKAEGKVKSEWNPTPLTNIASRDKDRWAGVQSLNMMQGSSKVEDKDLHEGPSALVAQQVQNPFAVSENKTSSDPLNLHHQVVEKESNGVFPVSPIAGQLHHANNNGMEENRGKSGRSVGSDTGSQQPQSNQVPLAATTNSGVLLAGSSNTES